ncbi:MAG: hypothetical protein HYX37_02955 [Rhizobiales bacterium]|nr:hypothetical protein [Hyphomicrobiales bacterium]
MKKVLLSVVAALAVLAAVHSFAAAEVPVKAAKFAAADVPAKAAKAPVAASRRDTSKITGHVEAGTQANRQGSGGHHHH